MNNMLTHAAATPPEDSNTRLITLTQGQFAIVDAADYEWLNQWKWFAHYSKKHDKWYAHRTVHNTTQMMHRVILGLTDSKVIGEHRDNNGLNNSRSNLRPATQSENIRNSKLYSTNTSGFKGVSQVKKTGKWRAMICANHRNKFLGSFSDKEDAARAYNEAALKYYGEFARFDPV